MNIRGLVDNLLTLADRVAPLVGGPLGQAAVEAARATIAAIDSVKDAVGEQDQGRLQVRREQLEQAVMAHADKTINSLS